MNDVKITRSEYERVACTMGVAVWDWRPSQRTQGRQSRVVTIKPDAATKFDDDAFDPAIYEVKCCIPRPVEVSDEVDELYCLDAKISTGWCALNLAIVNDDYDAVYTLLVRGASPDLESRRLHNTPLTWALRLNLDHMVQLLLQYRADPMLATCRGRSPLQVACKYSTARTVWRIIRAIMDKSVRRAAAFFVRDAQLDPEVHEDQPFGFEETTKSAGGVSGQRAALVPYAMPEVQAGPDAYGTDVLIDEAIKQLGHSISRSKAFSERHIHHEVLKRSAYKALAAALAWDVGSFFVEDADNSPAASVEHDEASDDSMSGNDADPDAIVDVEAVEVAGAWRMRRFLVFAVSHSGHRGCPTYTLAHRPTLRQTGNRDLNLLHDGQVSPNCA